MGNRAQFATLSLHNPLWQYACQLYSQPGVEAELLLLQDQDGIDINVLLSAHWLGRAGILWSAHYLPEMYRDWVLQQVVPLRQMRRQLKAQLLEGDGVVEGCWREYREKVKGLELESEQMALAILFAAYPVVPHSVVPLETKADDMIRHNMVEVLRYYGKDESDLPAVLHL